MQYLSDFNALITVVQEDFWFTFILEDIKAEVAFFVSPAHVYVGFSKTITSELTAATERGEALFSFCCY